jgi:type IV pilus assembly protein PilM
MKLNLSKKKEIVVLVFKDYVIRYLTMKAGDEASVKTFDEYYLPENLIDEGKLVDPNALKVILDDCVKNWGLKGKEVYFLAPDSSVVVRQMQVPPDLSDSEIKGHIYMEIGTSIHLPMENPLFEVEVLGVTENKKDILLFAAPEHVINDYVALLKDVKLKPVVCDLSPLAIYRLFFERNQVITDDHTLNIQFDLQSMTASIFREHKLVFMRHLKMDTDIKNWKSSKDEKGIMYLVWDGDEEFLEAEIQEVLIEVERVINFYRFNLSQGKEEISNIFLSGDHPMLTEIKNRINDITELRVSTFKEQTFSTLSGSYIPRRYHLCLGLALKEVK